MIGQAAVAPLMFSYQASARVFVAPFSSFETVIVPVVLSVNEVAVSQESIVIAEQVLCVTLSSSYAQQTDAVPASEYVVESTVTNVSVVVMALFESPVIVIAKDFPEQVVGLIVGTQGTLVYAVLPPLVM